MHSPGKHRFSHLLLWYLRKFPVDQGKKFLMPFVHVPEGNVCYTNRWGVRFDLSLHEYQMRSMYLYDLYEKNSILNLLRLVKPDDVFIDVGANIGSYTFNLAKFLSRGKVYSFEPNRTVQEIFLRNFQLNQPTNVVYNPFGLSDRTFTSTLFFDHQNYGASSIYSLSGEYSEEIQLVKFDDYCSSNHLEKIDLIKVDIEGAEFSFLRGAEEAIRRNRKLIIVMEMFNQHFVKAGYTSAEIFAYLVSLGFKAYLPKGTPVRLKQVRRIDMHYMDNIFFIRE